jgi:NADH-quinone oxidoreductase subunit G
MLQPGPNGFGAALLAMEHHAVSLSEAIASGAVQGIVCFEADIPAEMLAGVTVLGSADWRLGESAAASAVFVPTTVWAESDGTGVNFEGRAQRFQRAMRPGLPLRGLDAKYYCPTETPCGAPGEPGETPLHPPLVHRGDIPGGAERDAWQVISQLGQRFGGDPVTEPLSGRWSILRDLDPEGGGARILDLE